MATNSDNPHEQRLDDVVERFRLPAMSEADRADAVEQLRAGDVERLSHRALEGVYCIGFRLEPSYLERALAKREGRRSRPATPGVTIEDSYSGCSYDLVLTADHSALTYIAIRPHAGRTLGEIDRISEGTLTTLAAAFLADYPAAPTAHAERFAHPSIETVDAKQRLSAAPTVDYVAEIMRIADRVDDPSVSARRILQIRTGKSASTIDRLMRRARELDPTLPKDTRGNQTKTKREGTK